MKNIMSRKGSRPPLESISYGLLLRNRKNAETAAKHHLRLYYELEVQRQENRQEILSALREYEGLDIDLTNWVRVVDYQYSMDPLSLVGSMKLNGGRFNIGEGVNPNLASFSALYIGESEQTAFNERFPAAAEGVSVNLTQEELNLITKNDSYSVVKLVGNISNIFDLNDPNSTKNLLKVISKFRVSQSTQALANKANINPWTVVKDHEHMMRMCLVHNWRAIPNLFDIPSTPQIFASLVRGSGFAGILYPSTKGKDQCLALFPENFNDKSEVRIKNPPRDLKLPSIDNRNWKSHTF
jgi:hypothetical protein